MYNETDGAGWCYTAYCNSSCGTEKRIRPCHSATTPPPKPPPPPIDCFFLNPPRKVFELKYVDKDCFILNFGNI